ncbi:MAG TPA: ABC transporter ATP-binding protein [bacterium]|jgi:subfamily B ATP-binding cassette protein MsbA|nr:ABC transporter ATP-binding protein [bacterium]
MQDNKDFKSSFKMYLRLLEYLRPYRPRVILALVCMILSAVTTYVVMNELQPIIDGAFLKTSDTQAAFSRLIYWTLPLTFAAALLRAVSGYGQDYLNRYLGQKVVHNLRGDLYEHFLKLPMSFFNTQRTGILAARITNDVQVLQDSMVNIVGQGTYSALMVVSMLSLLIYRDWQLALLVLVIFPLGLYPIFRYGRKIRHSSGEGQKHLADLNAQLHETLGGIRVVKAFGMENHEKHKFKKTNDDFFGEAMKVNRAFASSSPIVETIATVVLLVLIGWMGYRALFLNNLTVGTFISFLGATFTLYPYLKNFNGLWGGLQHALAAAERCFHILDTVDPMVDVKHAVEMGPLKKGLEFKKVSFEYVAGHPILKDISFSLKKGEVIALVGPSGGGKSTLADMIPRFYQPKSGQILWDGRELSDIKLASLRSHIGIVTQETILFHDTIMSNIAYGKPGATFKEIEAAARAAYADEFIKNTPHGYNTVIGERGMKLSGGQRQRIAIARAILKNPPVMILDEATSALDNQSEQWVQKALEELMGHRTTLVIAHRLSTIRKANRILVIDKGRIVEEGKHTALLNKRGLYAKLYKMQFKTSTETPAE